MIIEKKNWDDVKYHGRYNRYPFTDVVSFVMGKFSHEKDKSKIRVLDLGCGGAHHLLFLAKEGFDYYGVDGSNEAKEIALSRLHQEGFFDDNRIQVSHFDRMPYEEGFFDLVIDRGSLVCNRRQDIPPLLKEIKRIMKPEAYLFSMILNDQDSSKNSARYLGDGDYTDFEGRLQDAGVLHYTNAQEAEKIFEDFKILNIEISLRKSELANTQNKEILAWNLITCQKQ